MSDGSLATVIS